MLVVLVPLQLDDGGFTPFAIGAVFLAAGLVETVVNPFLGRFSDRRGRLLPIRVALAASVVVAIAFAVAQRPVRDRRSWRSSRRSRSAPSTRPGWRSSPTATEAAGLSQAIGFGIMNTAWALGNMTGPALAGAIAEAAGDAVPYVLAAVLCAAHARARREPLEHPRRVEWPATVAPPVDERVVARPRIHRQPRLGRIPAVVPVDQLVHLAEVPPRAPAPATPPDRRPASRRPTASRCSCSTVERVDLAQPRHVRQRPAERGEIAAGVRAEVAQPQRQLSPAQRAVAHVRLEPLEVPTVTRRLGQDDPLPHDPLALAPPHTATVALPAEQAAQQAAAGSGSGCGSGAGSSPEARSGPGRSRSIVAGTARPAHGRRAARRASRRSGSPLSRVEGSIRLRRFLPRDHGAAASVARERRGRVAEHAEGGAVELEHVAQDGQRSRPRDERVPVRRRDEGKPPLLSGGVGTTAGRVWTTGGGATGSSTCGGAGGAGATGAGRFELAARAPATSSTSSTTRSISPASRSSEGRTTGGAGSASVRRRRAAFGHADAPPGDRSPATRRAIPRRPRPAPGRALTASCSRSSRTIAAWTSAGATSSTASRRRSSACSACGSTSTSRLRVATWIDDQRLPHATLRQLLDHTSGIPDYGRLPAYAAGRPRHALRAVGATRSCSPGRSRPAPTSRRARAGRTRTPASCSCGGSSTSRRPDGFAGALGA